MRALTLWRPWPWAIFELPPGVAKRVENRPAPPPQTVIGERLAIHAGKTYDDDAALELQLRFGGAHRVPDEDEDPIGLIGFVTVVGYRDHAAEVRIGARPGAAPADPWFCGPYGWLLDEVVALRRPVPCRGAQGIWFVPDAVLAEARKVGGVD